MGRKIVVHGGWNETDTLGDIWIFNTDSFSWMQPRTSGIDTSIYLYLSAFTVTQKVVYPGLPNWLTSMVNQLGVPAWVESVIHSL